MHKNAANSNDIEIDHKDQDSDEPHSRSNCNSVEIQAACKSILWSIQVKPEVRSESKINIYCIYKDLYILKAVVSLLLFPCTV